MSHMPCASSPLSFFYFFFFFFFFCFQFFLSFFFSRNSVGLAGKNRVSWETISQPNFYFGPDMNMSQTTSESKMYMAVAVKC